LTALLRLRSVSVRSKFRKFLTGFSEGVWSAPAIEFLPPGWLAAKTGAKVKAKVPMAGGLTTRLNPTERYS
jgi:hypothetical protein